MSEQMVSTVLMLLVLSLAGSASSKEDGQPWTDGAPADQNDIGDLDVMGALSECNETFRIEMSYLLALNESGSFPDETDRTPKCYVRCVLETVAVASSDGQFDPNRAEVALMGIRGLRALSDVKEAATACGDRKEFCKCERSYQFIKCLMEIEIKMVEKSSGR